MENSESCPYLGPCEDIPLSTPSLNVDNPPPFCPDPCPEPNQKRVDTSGIGKKKYKLGQSAQCDPYTSGQVRENMAADPNRRLIYRQPKSIRALTEGMLDLFSNITVIDEFGSQHSVPIAYATQERAVSVILQENVRKDSTVVDRVTLPLMSIYASSFSMDWDRYTYHWNQNFFAERSGKPLNFGSEKKPFDTAYGFSRGLPVDIGYQLNIWTYYVEDIYQIVEQCILKFSPLAYIRTQGNQWITAVKLDAISPDIDLEPGNTRQRLVRFQILMTAQHYIAQPIARYKTVLDERVDFMNSINEHEVTDIFRRLRITPEEGGGSND